MTDPIRLSIRHVTRYAYEPQAVAAVMRLRLFPSGYEGQTVESWQVTANDQPIEPNFTDAAGVKEALWSCDGGISEVEVIAEGIVVRRQDQGVVRGLKERAPAELFLRTTDLTATDTAIKDLASAARRSDTLETLHSLSASVRDAVEYKPASTNMATSAAAALEQGAGVCQDHAHVFIAAARSLGIPARYVAGYYVAGEGDDLTETHGWAEAFVEGLGWVGFDIANRTCPTQDHVRLICHLDAGRAAPVIGAIEGYAEETLTASVAIGQAQQ
ncbi:transglutaminase family protein [Parvularcula maris]|uniref:Transglutaminase family protein n=1 Tax=Parvularcula maris TaxID=2965077 RepID=A0A9X2L7P4_9PROT|nr:transglutaminase family protein [Parvularcula maris]MCQ8184628.1 transglutaminase family protein [Parvularcula maris]